MQFSRHVVYALIVAKYPLRDSMSHFSDQSIHVKVFENTADNGMGKEISSCERQHEPGSDISYRSVKVGCVLQFSDEQKVFERKGPGLTEYPLNAGSHATKNWNIDED